MVTQAIDTNTGMELLYKEYNWFANAYPPAVQKASDDFFLPGFQFILIGVSKNINTLMDKDAYFVTKVRINEFYDMFFRSSEEAVGLILEKILGKPNSRFNLNKVSDLEAKIITAFNDFMYNSIADLLGPPPETVERTNFDVIHLTFLVKDIERGKAAKFIITLPEVYLKPEVVVCEEDKFDNEYLAESKIPVVINVGTTRFKMLEVKNLDVDDIIVLEDSNIDHMILKYKDYSKVMNIIPDTGLVYPVESINEGEEDMAENDINLWDSIEVDMVAQFDSIKMSLGELKKIDEGLVVDITSIFENKVTLAVDDKPIARGELVIVNDRYGVKVKDVLAGKNKTVMEAIPVETTPPQEQEQVVQQQEQQPVENTVVSEQPAAETSEEDEFDYSDFELEDEDI